MELRALVLETPSLPGSWEKEASLFFVRRITGVKVKGVEAVAGSGVIFHRSSRRGWKC